jgi:hypothetical protein
LDEFVDFAAGPLGAGFGEEAAGVGGLHGVDWELKPDM